MSYTESKIVARDYIPHGLLTLCVITLDNGYKVVGESSCINPSDYNYHLGCSIAYNDGLKNAMTILGYEFKKLVSAGIDKQLIPGKITVPQEQ
jgi:hypothetical protein